MGYCVLCEEVWLGFFSGNFCWECKRIQKLVKKNSQWKIIEIIKKAIHEEQVEKAKMFYAPYKVN
jgi:hypothetical protein